MVPNLLPTAAELEAMCAGLAGPGGEPLGLVVERGPAPAGSPEDKAEGYLAVLARPA